MPTRDRVDAFIARVESNAHVEAIEEFYAEQASMQENDAPPRIGRAYLMERERKTLEAMRSVKSACIRPALIAGDHVVVRWVFEFEKLDGGRLRIDELAWQRWEGDRIAEEKFFYDPVQMRTK